MDLIGVSTYKISNAWWSSITMMYKSTGMVFVSGVRYLKWTDGVWMFHYIGGTKTGQENFRTKNDTQVRILSNYYTAFIDNFLPNMEIFNYWLEKIYIIVFGRKIIKIVKAPTWISQVSWGSNHIEITVDTTNIFPCIYLCFTIIFKECDEVCNFGFN